MGLGRERMGREVLVTVELLCNMFSFLRIHCLLLNLTLLGVSGPKAVSVVRDEPSSLMCLNA